jgi:exosortase J
LGCRIKKYFPLRKIETLFQSEFDPVAGTKMINTTDESIANSVTPSETGAGGRTRQDARVTALLWVGIAVLAASGCLAIYRVIFSLWVVWTSDPLRSIGLLICVASIALTLWVWRRFDWELRGTFWGLGVIALSFFMSYINQNFKFTGLVGREPVSVIPLTLPVYLYGSGVVLLFAGTRIWRQAWFPLLLLLLTQPVPGFVSGALDIPLQSASAQVARSFATMIHFAPTTPQLRLMFSPDFGMFIAPGCDGIRGAITMGYVALLIGYVKRIAWYRWAAYVVGGVLLGYLFNFLRLCALVLYYRLALGHPLLENIAKQADYVIGSCLFLAAILLFLRLVRRKQESPGTHAGQSPPSTEFAAIDAEPRVRNVLLKFAGLAILILAALPLPSSVLRFRAGRPADPAALAGRFPKTIGEFTLNRTWFEQEGGTPVEMNAAYTGPGSDEVILGIWISPLLHVHDVHQCWLARGLQADTLASDRFLSAGKTNIDLRTGFYSDGITDSIVANAFCSPTACTHATANLTSWIEIEAQQGQGAGSGAHLVSIMVRIDRVHSTDSKQAVHRFMSDEAQRFLAGLDPLSLSRDFQ